MLSRPTTDHDTIAGVIRREYGLGVATVEDAPRGFVAETFAVTTTEERRLFVKLLPLWADQERMRTSLPVLAELQAVGIHNISHVVPTLNGAFFLELGGRTLALFEYVEGVRAGESGYDFASLVRLLARVHHATDQIRSPLPREEFALDFLADFEQLLHRALNVTPTSAVRTKLQVLMQAHQDELQTYLVELQTRAAQLHSSNWTPVLTHGDALGSNVIVAHDGTLHLIDWDGMLLAPAEHDTWFHLAPGRTAGFFGLDVSHTPDEFLSIYREIHPGYQPDPTSSRFYLLRRFFEDLYGYLDQIGGSSDHAQQARNFADLEEVCFGWLWPLITAR